MDMFLERTTPRGRHSVPFALCWVPSTNHSAGLREGPANNVTKGRRIEMSHLRICLWGRRGNPYIHCPDVGLQLGMGLRCRPWARHPLVADAGSPLLFSGRGGGGSLFPGVNGHQSRVFCGASGSFIWPIRFCVPVSKYRGGRNMNLALSNAFVLRNSLGCSAMLFPIRPWRSSPQLDLVSEH